MFILFTKVTGERLGLLTRLLLSEEISMEGKHGQQRREEVMVEAGKPNTCPLGAVYSVRADHKCGSEQSSSKGKKEET